MPRFRINDTFLDLPDFLETRVEDDTLVASSPDIKGVNLRLTVITTRKDGKPVARAGERVVRKKAAEAKVKLHEGADRVWYQITRPASEGSRGSLMHYWFVGMDGHTLVVSCFVDAEKREHPVAQRVLASVEPMIQSFTRDDSDR